MRPPLLRRTGGCCDLARFGFSFLVSRSSTCDAALSRETRNKKPETKNNSALRQFGNSAVSIRLQDVAHQCAGEVARQAVERGRIFLEEAGDLARHLVLLAKRVIGIVVEHRALAIDE